MVSSSNYPASPGRPPLGAASTSKLRWLRDARGWSQQELAERAGLSRPEISAIETGRLVPSVRVALALGRTLAIGVEELFGTDESATLEWAWQPRRLPCRAWVATVGQRRLLIPCENGFTGLTPHDLVVSDAPPAHFQAPPTLVLAGCDPAAALLSDLLRARGVRVLSLVRSSQRALALLGGGLVHVAGVHLANARRSGNVGAVRRSLGSGYRLSRWAVWETGIALARGLGVTSVDERRLSRLSWVGRDPGSGAQACMGQLFRGRREPECQLVANDHREVAESIRLGAAQAGVCIRVTAEEAELDFLRVYSEPYDLCYRAELESDPAVAALLDLLGDRQLRRLLGELPGYLATTCGQPASVG